MLSALRLSRLRVLFHTTPARMLLPHQANECGHRAVQVGDAIADASITPKEALMPEQYVTVPGYSRPVLEINATTGGSDLIAEACAAFASIAKLFREEPGQEDFANAMTKHARQLYDWMKTTQGSMYSEVHPELKRTYPSQVRSRPRRTPCSDVF